MNTEDEISAKITELTLHIQEKYPELYEHIDEMPVTNPDKNHPDINKKILQDYYDKLHSMMIRYAQEHPASFDVG
jgi:hypothetical protein